MSERKARKEGEEKPKEEGARGGKTSDFYYTVLTVKEIGQRSIICRVNIRKSIATYCSWIQTRIRCNGV